MSRPPKKLLPPAAHLNFLLGASDNDLGSFELARLAEVANLRSDLHAILDKLIDEMATAAVCGWFRQTNRETLKQAIQSPEEHTAEIMAWAKERIKNGQRTEEELVPRSSLPPGAAHLAAALRYAQNNMAKGLCSLCPQPLAHHSVRFCEKHLAYMRSQHPPKAAKGELPGSISWLYGDGLFESQQGKRPGTVKALKEANEKRKHGRRKREKM